MIILCSCFFCFGQDDPPKTKKQKGKQDTIIIQSRQKQNIIELQELNRLLDSLNRKQDTLIKKRWKMY